MYFYALMCLFLLIGYDRWGNFDKFLKSGAIRWCSYIYAVEIIGICTYSTKRNITPSLLDIYLYYLMWNLKKQSHNIPLMLNKKMRMFKGMILETIQRPSHWDLFDESE